MNLKLNILFAFTYALVAQAFGQQTFLKVDTVPTQGSIHHMYLNIQIPAGEMYMQSSNMCGSSITKLSAPDPTVKHEFSTSVDPNGNLRRSISLKLDGSTRNAALSRGAVNADINPAMLQLTQSGDGKMYQSVYNPDPSTSTDLYLDLGMGRSRLDFSDLSLSNVEIHSAFSDIHLTYSSPNKVQMEKLDIHAAKAKIVLKNLECARADLVSIINDMGDTKVILGSHRFPGSTVFIQQGMGDCILVINRDHPVKIVFKNGLFTTQSKMPEGFEEVEKGTYINQAFRRHGENEATQVICNIDFGNVSVYGGK